LLNLPLPLQNYAEQRLHQLAHNPASLSRAAAFPYPPGSQIFQPEALLLDDDSHELTFLFRFGQDEVTLVVLGIGHLVR